MSSRWMLYTYDALGLGHVRRALSIAHSALERRPRMAALLMTCSPLVDALPVPPGLDYIKLPSARKLGNHEYIARTLRLAPERLRALRAAVLREAALEFDPELLLVDKSPLGLMGELASTLAALRRRRHTRLILGWRDILDEPEATMADWRTSGTPRQILRHYDELWIYGDPRVFDARTEYRMPRALAERVRFMGFLSPVLAESDLRRARAALGGDGAPVALVTVGGGEDGEPVLAAWIDAARRGLLPAGLRSVLVTGPCMPAAAQSRLREAAPEGVEVRTFTRDLAAMVAAADLVVSMAGYNTSCEILGAGTPAVLVPRMVPRREQWVRARRLAALGACECVDGPSVDGAALARAAAVALERGRHPVPGLALAGLENVAAAVNDRLDRANALRAAAPRRRAARRVASGGAA